MNRLEKLKARLGKIGRRLMSSIAGRALLGSIIWPISTIFSIRRIWKTMRDPEISTFDSTFDGDVGASLYRTCPRLLGTRPPPEELVRVTHLLAARYQLTPGYIFTQKFTLGFKITVDIVWTLLYTLFSVSMPEPEHFSFDDCAEVYLKTTLIFGLAGFIFCSTHRELLEAAIDAIMDPFKRCAHNRRSLTEDIVLRSALLSQQLGTMRDIIDHSDLGKLNLELLNMPDKIECLKREIQGSTQLPKGITKMILEYSVPPAFLKLPKNELDNEGLGLEGLGFENTVDGFFSFRNDPSSHYILLTEKDDLMNENVKFVIDDSEKLDKSDKSDKSGKFGKIDNKEERFQLKIDINR